MVWKKINLEKACSETPYILMYKLVTTNANENITIIDRNLIDTELINILEEENKQILIEEEKVKERAQHLTLKFYLFDQLKIINSKKPDSVYSLKSAVMNEFGINDIKKDNVRIRAINLSNSQMLEPFKEELKVFFNKISLLKK